MPLRRMPLPSSSSFFLLLLLLLLQSHHHLTTACTCFLVTKSASQDNLNTLTYAADSHTLFGYLQYWPAGTHPAGTQRAIYDWDSGVYLGNITEAPVTYNVVGNVNEYGLAITESTWGGIEQLAKQSVAVVDYGSLIYITLSRAKTAREAITVMTELVAEYGYASEGESFSIADSEEVWILEMVGKGEYEKGAVWVAEQIPDGFISGHANQARIRFLSAEKEAAGGQLWSEDVISFARKIGVFPQDASDESFSFSDVYNPLTFTAARGCEGRVWDFFNRATAAEETMAPYLDYALGFNLTNRMPLYIKPVQPLATKEVVAAMRSHFENTPLAFDADVGAGSDGLPYRWRPLTWSSSGNDNTYFHERAAGTQQTGFNLLAQLRGDKPDPIKAVMYFAVDDTDSSVLTPFYGGMTQVPPAYGPGDIMQFDLEKAFFVFNLVANFAYARYALIHPEVQARQAEMEEKHFELVAELDASVVELYEKDKVDDDDDNNDEEKKQQAIALINDACVSTAQALVSDWLTFFGHLFVKYMDGNVKSPPAAGALLPTVEQPGYKQPWYDLVVKETGDRYVVPPTSPEAVSEAMLLRGSGAGGGGERERGRGRKVGGEGGGGGGERRMKMKGM